MSQTHSPFSGSLTWPPEMLNYAIGELRREFPETSAERIVKMVDMAARVIRPELGRARLLQRAREGMRAER